MNGEGAVHELSVMSYLLETVEEQARAAGAQRVLAINLLVGERTSFMDDSLLFYFEQLTPGRLCAGAELHIRRQPMSFRCEACDRTFSTAVIDRISNSMWPFL